MSAAENDRGYRGAIPPDADERARVRAHFDQKNDREVLIEVIRKSFYAHGNEWGPDECADDILAWMQEQGFGRLPVTEPTEAEIEAAARALASIEPGVARERMRAEVAESKINRALDEHLKDVHPREDFCQRDGEAWPCRTVRILDEGEA